jgi:hypothetical protein
METLIGGWCEFLLTRWQNATSLDYCFVCVVIVTSGWLISRLSSR